MRTVLTLMLPLFLLGGDEFAAGVRAYREDRFEDAFAAFARAEASAGHGASAELLSNLALAALRVRKLRVAEFSAEKAAVRGGPEFEPFREFVFGSAAFARCELAKAETELTDPDPTAFGRAIAHAEQARDAWQRAATSRADWPEARRNVERALLALDDLLARKREADRNRRSKREQTARTPDDPEQRDPDALVEEVEQDPVPQQGATDLPPGHLERLLAMLAEKEKEKRALRRARQQVRSVRVEKDW